jgi:tol-pal system protein YbgF
MLKQCALILLASCFAAPAQALFYTDDDARKLQQLEERVLKLEDAVKQQTRSMLDLQGQIEALSGEIRKLRGQNEELAHGLQDAEKREKDFYVDLDTRLRRFESIDSMAQNGESLSASAVPADPNDPTLENRAFEAAYGLFKGGSHANAAKAFQEFLKKFPGSAHVANANYWLGNAQLALKDCKSALSTYQGLLKAFPDSAKAADVLFNIAECQKELEQDAAAQKTLKQLVTKYPNSEAANKVKKQPAISK